MATSTLRTFIIEVEGGSTIIGIEKGTMFSISLSNGRKYVASIERIHQTLARWHAKEHPIGKPRRKFLTSSEQLRNRKK